MSLGESFDGVLVAAKQGADWAWADLYREYSRAVIGYLASRGVSEADDVASEVFLDVARNVSGFEGDETSFRSWLFVIVHRRLIDERRARGRRPSFIELPDDDATNEGGNVEAEALDRLRTEELMKAFDDLSEGQRNVLALRIIAGLSLDETARALGKNVGAVKAMQRRGVKSMHSLMLQGAGQ